MSNTSRWIVLALIPALVLAGVVGWVWRGVANASTGAVQTPAEAPPRAITVVGNGKVTARPDMAMVQVGVETRNESAEAAVSENTQRMNAVLVALKNAGIAEQDIQTANFSLYADQQRGPNGELLRPIQYVASNIVRVTVRDLEKVGAVLDAVVNAGANQVYGISFSVANPNRLQLQAEENAVEDARARAQALAAKAGVQLGDVLSISETISTPPPILYRQDVAVAAPAAAPVPVQPGELEFNAQVQIVYAIR
jgi:uncharacterized protein YggE